MKKKNFNNGANYYYDEEGNEYVSNQILDSYNCGVIDQMAEDKNNIENEEIKARN